ncbi:MAG: T9SS type A sorting domain-containing protein [Bacteroidales bacterium]|nr:T9SS type A sorting domain-containing protein [Bacteroidales bacterium]MCF8455056.1 T9SS type A sorting domain-containing protein [Bacteroidales bacterium]
MKKFLIIGAFLLATSPLFSQWSLLAPHQIDYHYNDLVFLNNDTGFVVGDSASFAKGIILKTMNGGQTWDTTFCNGPIYSIQFISNDIGFAACFNSYFYKTYDGGINWIEISFNPPIIYQFNNSIYFKNALEGYLSSSISFNSQLLFKTTNGGLDWQKVFYPGTGYQVGGGSICFPTNNIGFIGLASKTFDGGSIWTQWLDSIITPLPFGYVNVRCTYFLDENFGMIGTHYMAGSPYNNNRGMIGITHDGGHNYIFRQLNGLVRISDIVMVDENRAYAVGQLSVPNPNDNSVFLASLDGGDTWYYQEYEHDTVFPYPTMQAVCFPSDKIGYAVSYYGQIYKTTNSGGELMPILSSTNPSLPENDQLLYPNPASDYIYLQCKNLKAREFSLVIYNAEGRIVQNTGKYVYNNSCLEINVSQLPNGIYFLKVTGGEGKQVHKFIKN